jgi:hypothetical protein
LETKELVELFPSVQGTQIQPLRQILWQLYVSSPMTL